LLLIRFVAGVELRQIGLYRWREWSMTERSYFVQVMVIANVVFALIFMRQLRYIAAHRALWGEAAVVVLTQLAWGFYQELMYRGVLQTALVKRLGPAAGIVITNLVFTFGPLHFYHFGSASPWPTFAAIFAIGLFFSVLRWRSGNLWIVGFMHGLGNAYIEGLRVVGRSRTVARVLNSSVSL